MVFTTEMIISTTQMIISTTKKIVEATNDIVDLTNTKVLVTEMIIFAAKKMVSAAEPIFSVANAMVFATQIIISEAKKMLSIAKKMLFVPPTMLQSLEPLSFRRCALGFRGSLFPQDQERTGHKNRRIGADDNTGYQRECDSVQDIASEKIKSQASQQCQSCRKQGPAQCLID